MNYRKFAEDIYGKMFYAASIGGSEPLKPLPFNENYVCLVWALQKLTPEESIALGMNLIKSGCRYILSAGIESKTLEVCFDMAYVQLEIEEVISNEQHVMTSAHSDEDIEDIITFFAHSTNFDYYTFTKFLVLFVGEDPIMQKQVENLVSRSVITF